MRPSRRIEVARMSRLTCPAGKLLAGRNLAARKRATCQHLPEGVEWITPVQDSASRDLGDDPTSAAWDRRMPARRPEYQATGEIALRITPGGFGTTAGPELRLDGLELVAGDTRVPATGSFGDLADKLGVEFGAPANLSRMAVAHGGMTLLILIRQLRGSSSTGTRSAMLRCAYSIRASSRSCGRSTSTSRSCWTIARTGHHQETTSIRLRTPTSAHMIMMADPSGTRRSVRFGMSREFRSIEDLVAFWREGRALLRAG